MPEDSKRPYNDVMCGRFSLKIPAALTAQKFEAVLLESWNPSEAFVPGAPIPLIRMEGGRRIAKTAFWGLVPSWAMDRSFARHMFNARAETLKEKPAFKEAFSRRRCLIPADGFFEWNRRSSKTQKPVGPPWVFTMKTVLPFGMAGLWEAWEDHATGGTLETCAIITTRANDLVAPHHDRMPVILHPNDYALWLEENPDSNDFVKLLEPIASSQMEETVSSLSEGPLELDLG